MAPVYDCEGITQVRGVIILVSLVETLLPYTRAGGTLTITLSKSERFDKETA